MGNTSSKQLIHSGLTGDVKELNPLGGFITSDFAGHKNVFFFISMTDDDIRVGDEVKFDLYLGPVGYIAESVQVVNIMEVDDSDDLLSGIQFLHLSENEKQRSRANNKYAASGGNVGQGKSRTNQIGEENVGNWDGAPVSRTGSDNGHGDEKTSGGARGGHAKDRKPDTYQNWFAKPRVPTKDVEPNFTAFTGSTPTQLSRSAKERERGNMFYKSATDDLCPTVRISRLDNAITCYKDAVSCSNTRDEKASAMKNFGMASWKLATVVALKSAETDEKDKIILEHFEEALKNFCMAYELKSYKSVSWGDKLKQSWYGCSEESTAWLATMNTTEMITGFSKLLGYVPDCRLKANGCIKYSTLLFHEGLTAWQEGEYKQCYRYMRECYQPIQEAERLCENDSFIKTEVRVLREDVYVHTCMAESIMARTTGDDLTDDHLKNNETVNIDTVWTVIDFYTKAVVLCRDKDLEQEAIAYSRIGRVYGKVLRLSSRGKDYYKKAIQLALSMTPRTFHGVGWYKESTKFVEDFQKRLNKDEVEDKDKKAALEEMKEDVKKLSKIAEKNDEEFLKELYKAWPPKAPGAKLDDNLSAKNKVLKAVSHYHPDKVDKEVHGNNWFFFSQEITKHLNVKYTCYKSVD